MPISAFGEGLQKIISFLPGTYGTSLIRNHTTVSYTHLKKQAPAVAVAVSTPSIPIDWNFLKDAVIGEKLDDAGIKAVSYTHLDVYKRQEPTPTKTEIFADVRISL